MGANDINIGIKLRFDGKEVEGGVSISREHLRQFATDAKRAGSEASTLGSGIQTVGRYVAGAFTVGAVARFTSELVDAQVQADKLRNSLEFSTGSQTKAAEEMAYVRSEAYRLGLELNTTGSSYAKLQASANGTTLAGEKARSVFEAVAKAGMVMGLSAEEQNGALLAISQMMSKGTVQAEELRGQLGERIPGALNIAARALGVTTAQLGKMLEQGEVLAADFLPKFAAELEKTLGDAPARAAQSTQAALNRMSTAWTDAKQGFNDSGAMSPAVLLMERITASMKGFADGVRQAKAAGWDGVGRFFAGVGSGVAGALGAETDPVKEREARIEALRRRIEAGQYRRDDAPGFKTSESKADLEAELESLIRGGKFKLPDLKAEAAKTEADLQAMFGEIYGRWEAQLAKSMPSSAARKAIKDYEREFAVLQKSNPQAYDEGLKPLRKKLADAVSAETSPARERRLTEIDADLKASEQLWKAWSDEVVALNKRALVGDSEALAARQVAEQKILEAKLAAAQAKVAVAANPADLTQATREAELLQREITAAQSRAADEREALAKSEGDAILAARLDAAKREGRTLEAAGLQFTKEYQDKVLKAALDGNDDLLAAYAATGQEMLRQGAFDEAKARYEELFAQMKEEMDAVRQAAEQDGGVLAAIDAGGQAQEIKNKFIPALRAAREEMSRMAGASPINGKAVAEAGRQIQEVGNQMSPFWKNFWDDMHRGLTDNLMRSAERDGGSFGKRFVDGLNNYFKTAALKLSIQLAADGIIGMAKSALGFGGAAGGGGGGNILSNVSGGYNLLNGGFGQSGYNTVANIAGWTGNGAWGAGFAHASTVGDAIAAYNSAALTAIESGAPEAALEFAKVATDLAEGATAASGALGTFSSALPWVGGGLVLASALGLFGDDGPAVRTATVDQFGADEYGYQSALGGFAPWHDNRWFSGDMSASQEAFAKTVIALDGRIAAAISETDMGAIRAALEGDTPDTVGFGPEHTDVSQSGAFDRIWRERYGLVLDAMLPGMGKLSTEATLTGDQIMALVGTISQVRVKLADAGLDTVLQQIAASAPEAAASMLTVMQYAVADPIADATTQAQTANRSLMSAWTAQGDSLRDLIAGYDNSTTAAQALAAAAQTRYQTELQLAAQIQTVLASSASMFGDTRRNFELAGLDTSGKFDYFDREAKGYADIIAGLTDPALIADYGKRLNATLNQAFGLLSPEQQKEKSPEFAARATAGEELVKGRLLAVEGLITADKTDLRNEIKGLAGVVQALNTATAALATAATSAANAAATPQTIRLLVGNQQAVEIGSWAARNES